MWLFEENTEWTSSGPDKNFMFPLCYNGFIGVQALFANIVYWFVYNSYSTGKFIDCIIYEYTFFLFLTESIDRKEISIIFHWYINKLQIEEHFFFYIVYFCLHSDINDGHRFTLKQSSYEWISLILFKNERKSIKKNKTNYLSSDFSVTLFSYIHHAAKSHLLQNSYSSSFYSR